MSDGEKKPKRKKRISVHVPCWYVKDKRINFPLEVLAATDTPLTLRAEGCEPLAVKPSTLGFFILLEWIDSKFFRSPMDCDMMDVCRAVACANGGRNLFPPDQGKIDVLAMDIAVSHGDAIVANIVPLAEWLLSVPYYGYEMLRNSTKSRKKERFLFAGPSVAAVVNAGAHYANLSPEESIWNLPLALAGHLAEVNDCGKLDPARPKDPEDLRQKAKEAIERERNGELHPWQVAFPEYYPLTFRQAKRKHEEDLKHGVNT